MKRRNQVLAEQSDSYADGKPRCPWVAKTRLSGADLEAMIAYHDNEWCPESAPNDNQYLFEMLTLSGAQAGLSWSTILKKREAYRKAYDSWCLESIATFSDDKIQELLHTDSGIIRNKQKISASICNSKVFIALCEKESFLSYLQRWFPKGPLTYEGDPPVRSEISEAISKDLVAKGFKFVGPVIIQAYLLSIGLMRGHDKSCHVHQRKRSKAAGV